jgi:spore coat protein H
MKTSRRHRLAVSLLVVAGLFSLNLTSATATAPNYSRTNSPYVEGTDAAAPMFDPLDISQVVLTTDQATFDYFRSCCDWSNEGPWMHAQLTMTVKGVTVGPLDVGWHLKGAWGSWVNIDSKPGLKIRVDAFVKNQKIFGVKKLILNNMWQEGSAMNQQLTLRLFRAMNVPASRTGYANVRINGLNYGIYTNIESLDQVSLARWYSSTKHLYKGGVPYHWCDLVPDCEWVFQVDTGSKTDRSDLMPLLQANVSPNWWTDVQKVADMQEMTREWAVEYIIGHWDGYANNGNNYFVHSDANGIFTMLPWGVDNTVNGPMDYHYANKIMAQQCLQAPQCRAMYNQAVADASYAITNLALKDEAGLIAAHINPILAVEPAGRRNWGYNDTLGQQNWILGNLDYSSVWALQNYYDGNLPEVAWNDAAMTRVQVGNTTLTVNGLNTDLGKVTLAKGARNVTVTPTMRQSQATYTVTGNTSLASGWNIITIRAKSAVNPSTQVFTTRNYTLQVYVPTQQTKSLTVLFDANKKLLPTSVSALAALGASLRTYPVSAISATSSGISTVRTAQLAAIVNELKKQNVAPLSTKTISLNSKLKSGTVTITLQYVA